MPIKICKVNELTPHGRGRKPSEIESSKDFMDLRIKLTQGLKPNEAIEVQLEPSKVKTMRELFKRRVKKLLAHLHLDGEWEVQGYRANGIDYVSVAHTLPVPANKGDGMDRDQEHEDRRFNRSEAA